MNFFSHAVVAAWSQSAPAFVLGAMLPDFVTMIGAQKPIAHDPHLLAGVRFHELTDSIFHSTPSFQALQREARMALSGAGVRRGSDRAAAHVGIEILIDGELSHDTEAYDLYSQALEGATPSEMDGRLAWASAADAAHFAELCDRLKSRGKSRAPVEASIIADRVTGALSRRPRLSLDWAAREAVRCWVETAKPEVAARMTTLLDELITGLSAEGLTFVRTDVVERKTSP